MADLNNTNNDLGDASVTEIAGKITAAVVVLLFFAVVFFFFLHLYAKWWRQDDQRNPSLHLRHDPVFAALYKGIDPNVLKSMPVLVFRSDEFKEGLECSVCLSEVVDGEKARLLPKCKHGFHVDCIDMWFQSHSSCPLCRNPVSVSPKTSSRYESVEFTSSTTFLSVSDSSSESSNAPDSNEGTLSSQSEVNEGTSYMVIDIPIENVAEIFAAGDRNGGDDEERKSPPAVLTRMQTFKRLLSRENRVAACSPSTVDV